MTDTLTQSELLNRIYHSWTDLRMFIDGLTEQQMTIPTDAAGWTVKDHLIHLAVWEDSVDAHLQGLSRRERMGIDPNTWRNGDVDKINAMIQQRHKDTPLADVLERLQTVHEQVIAQIRACSDDELCQPYHYVKQDTEMEGTRMDWIIWNTYEHYDEHLPWMDKIAHPRPTL